MNARQLKKKVVGSKPGAIVALKRGFRMRIEELEAYFGRGAKRPDCGILDVDDAKAQMQLCEEYASLLWTEHGELPDNCTTYGKVRRRAAELIDRDIAGHRT